MTSDPNIPQLRQQIIQSINAANNSMSSSLLKTHGLQAWWLLGTSGCHLCAHANTILQQFGRVEPINYVELDIANFADTLMLRFAGTIPTLLTPTQRIDYPFSIMDLQVLTTL